MATTQTNDNGAQSGGGLESLMADQVQRTSDLLAKIDLAAVEQLVQKMFECYETGRRVFILGNGGSGATASHFCEDLAKSTITDPGVEKRLRVMSLTDNTPFILALGNDWGFETVFREQLVTLAEPDDLVIGISGSGNSPNVISAMQWAKENDLYTVGWTGFNGGKLKSMVDLSLHSAVLDMEVAENTHMIIMHLCVLGMRTLISRATA